MGVSLKRANFEQGLVARPPNWMCLQGRGGKRWLDGQAGFHERVRVRPSYSIHMQLPQLWRPTVCARAL